MLYSPVQALAQISGKHFFRREICRSRVTFLPGKNHRANKKRSADLCRALGESHTASVIDASSSRMCPGEVLHGHKCQLGMFLANSLGSHSPARESW